MAGRLGVGAGGIFGLAGFLEEHGEAVEHDLLTRGYRLADIGGAFSWRDLGVLVRRWGGEAGTATYRSVHGHEGWTVEAQLLAHLIDAVLMLDFHTLRIGGAKSARAPKPIERPWDAARPSYGSGAIPIEEVDEWVESTLR